MAVQPLKRILALVMSGVGVYYATLAAGLSVTTEMPQRYSLDGGLANRDVTMFAPTPQYEGAGYEFYNRGTTNNLVLKNAAGSTISTLLPGQGITIVWGDTDGWIPLAKSGAGAGGSDFGAPGLLTDQIGESTASAKISMLHRILLAAGGLVKDSQAWLFGDDSDIAYTHDGSASVRVTNAAAGTVGYDDDVLNVCDPADPTKRARLDAGAVTAGQTRVVNLVDQDVATDQWIQKTTTTINNASCRTLNATPVSIIPAPGAGKAIVDVRVSVKYVYATAAFDSVGAGDDLEIRYTDGSGAKVANDIETTGMLDQTSDQYRMSGPVLTSMTPVANAAVVLRLATGEVYAAAGGGSLVVQAYYRVVTL